MDLYYGIVSGNSARSIFALNEARRSAGVRFTAHRVDTRAGENRTAEYLAKNPLGKIPALIDGDVRLWESNAMNWYLAEKHPEAGLLPASIAGRASVQRWLFYQAAHVSPACVRLFQSTNPRTQAHWGTKPDAQVADGARKELARFLPVLEGALTGREWLEGAFSLADIAYAPHLWMIVDGGYDLGGTPAIHAWLERMKARPAWRETEDLVFGA